jgi:hypothetical protein
LLKPILHEAIFFLATEAKNKSWQCDWSAKKFAAKKFDHFLFFTVRANKFGWLRTGFKLALINALAMPMASAF